MRVSVLQENLAQALSIVSRAVDSRPTLPVLANVLLETDGDTRLRLSATNLELSITTYIGANVEKAGAITLPAKTFAELVNTLSPERVDLTLDAATHTVNLRCGTTSTNIKGIAATEFPQLPEADSINRIALPGALLKAMITETMFAAAKEDGIELAGVSGYRSYARQKAIFEANVQKKGEQEANRVSAYPGQSEHQTGLTMDVSSKSVNYALEEEFGESKEGKWLAEHAHEYGFIIRYPKDKEDVTGYVYEPWHIRYVGKELAAAVYESGLTLEEFAEQNSVPVSAEK